jgi:uncharacterized protein (DUF4415 family)
MTARKKDSKREWVDPDDAPEWTDEVFDRAQIAVGGEVFRPASGTLTKRGRPPIGEEPKQQVTLRLAPKVIRHFKQGGHGWQSRLNEALEQYVIRDAATGKAKTSSKANGARSRKSA